MIIHGSHSKRRSELSFGAALNFSRSIETFLSQSSILSSLDDRIMVNVEIAVLGIYLLTTAVLWLAW